MIGFKGLQNPLYWSPYNPLQWSLDSIISSHRSPGLLPCSSPLLIQFRRLCIPSSIPAYAPVSVGAFIIGARNKSACQVQGF